MKKDRGSTGTLPIYGDRSGITAEVIDIVVDPIQGLHLIQEADVVISDTTPGELWMGQESESRQTVVDGYNDDLLALVNPVIERPIFWVPVDVTPSMNVK